MHEDLYFFTEINRALHEVDTVSVLREAFDRIRAQGKEPRYQRGYQQFLQFMAAVRQSQEEMRTGGIAILVERDGTVLADLSMDASQQEQIVGSVNPGHYRIRTGTGLLLWQGLLAEEDLLLEKAFPGQPIKLAADTGESSGPPTRVIEAAYGLTLKVHAGVEAGYLVLVLKSPETGK